MKFRELSEPVQDLVTYLLTLASPPEKQIEIHGIGDPASEMRDYINFPMGSDEDLEKIRLEKKLSSTTINKIENLFSELRLHPDGFWQEFKYSTEWQNTREKAKELIRNIGLSEVEIITQFSQDLTYADGGVIERPTLFIVIERDRTERELRNAIVDFQERQ